MDASFSAPFLAAYWPYVVAVLAGIIATKALTFLSTPNEVRRVPDVDPLQDSELDDFPQLSPDETVHVPYPYFDERCSEEEMKEKSHEFFKRMDKRRTVRQISSEDVPLEVIENIIRTAGRLTTVVMF